MNNPIQPSPQSKMNPTSYHVSVAQREHETAYQDRGVGDLWYDKDTGDIYILAQVMSAFDHKEWSRLSIVGHRALYTWICLGSGNRLSDPAPLEYLLRNHPSMIRINYSHYTIRKTQLK